MERIVDRAGGLDVHKDVIVAEAHLPGGAVEQGRFATTTPGLLVLRDWLVTHGVTRVGMESTGVYWKPPYYLLEDVMQVWLLNARHMRNIPGRKTDVADAAWICQLIGFGLVRPSFVPPAPIRELRNLTRYRKAQIEERTREVQRLDKILQDAGVKLSSVASDILGKSGRAMLAALVAGATDTEVLADLALDRLRAKIPALWEALTCRFSGHHAVIVSSILAKLDFLDELITSRSTEIEQVIAPFAHQIELLDTVPGIDRRTAQGLLTEIGAGHGCVRHGLPTGVLGRGMPGQPRVCGQVHVRQNPQRTEMAGRLPARRGDGCGARQERLPGRPVRPVASSAGPRQGPGRCRAQHPGGGLPHARPGPALPRPGP
nr:IS110 family transposase [Kutzneria sp. CA-103260]